MIDVSVVTVNYREARKTREAVEAILRSTGISLEVLLIDNSCDSGEADALSLIDDPRVRLHIAEKNTGPADAYNFALDNVTGRYVFILNNDAMLIDERGLALMTEYLDANPEVGVIQPHILSINDHRTFDYAGAGGGYLDLYGYPFCRGRLFQTMEEDSGQYEGIVDITWASGCAMFARKQLLTDVGGFEPVYFAYAEDVDISLAIWRHGYRVRSFPMVRVFHSGSWSWNKHKFLKIKLIHRNHLMMFLKCYPLKEIIVHLPARLLFEIGSMLFYALNGAPQLVLSVVRSHFEVIRLLPYIARRRRRFFAGGESVAAPFYRGSIVFSYYLRWMKLFKDLKPGDFS